MIEAYGNIWDHYKEYDALVITTNGFVKKNGEAVMGRGIALEAKKRFPWLPKSLGAYLMEFGNHVNYFGADYDHYTGWSLSIITFPVKPEFGPNGIPGWKAKADIKLIEQSLIELKKLVAYMRWEKILMPRPGCGNGGLEWGQVKPTLEHILDDRYTIMERA